MIRDCGPNVLNAMSDPLGADLPGDLGNEVRLGNGHRAEHVSGNRQVSHRRDRLERAKPTAHLDMDAASGPARDRGQQGGILAVAGGTVEIHQVHPDGPSLNELLELGVGIVLVDGLAVLGALAQANDLAVADVDRGKNVHA